MPNTNNLVISNPQSNPFVPNILNVARVDFTAAQMLTLFTVPLTVLPAQAGYVYCVQWGLIYKTTTAVFTTAGLSSYGLRYNNSGLTSAINFLGTVLTAVTSTSTFTTAGTQGQVLSLSSDVAADVGGKALVLTSNVDFGGTGSPCTMLFGYYIIPSAISNVPVAG